MITGGLSSFRKLQSLPPNQGTGGELSTLNFSSKVSTSKLLIWLPLFHDRKDIYHDKIGKTKFQEKKKKDNHLHLTYLDFWKAQYIVMNLGKLCREPVPRKSGQANGWLNKPSSDSDSSYG